MSTESESETEGERREKMIVDERKRIHEVVSGVVYDTRITKPARVMKLMDLFDAMSYKYKLHDDFVQTSERRESTSHSNLDACDRYLGYACFLPRLWWGCFKLLCYFAFIIMIIVSVGIVGSRIYRVFY
jgi:hypothetical protein